MWWVMFPLKKYTLLFFTQHKCVLSVLKCVDERKRSTNKRQMETWSSVSWVCFGHLQPHVGRTPPQGWRDESGFKKEITNNMHNIYVSPSLSVGVSLLVLGLRVNITAPDWQQTEHLGLVERQKPEQLSSHRLVVSVWIVYCRTAFGFYTVDRPLLPVSLKTHHAEVPRAGKRVVPAAAAGVFVSHLLWTIVTVPAWCPAAAKGTIWNHIEPSLLSILKY